MHYSIYVYCTDILTKHTTSQIHPTELEEIITQMPEIKEVGVVGVPNKQTVEAPMAVVVLKEPCNDRNQRKDIAAKIHAHMNLHCSTRKQLTGGILFTAQLPKNTSGKLSRRELAHSSGIQYCAMQVHNN